MNTIAERLNRRAMLIDSVHANNAPRRASRTTSTGIAALKLIIIPDWGTGNFTTVLQVAERRM